MSILVCTTMWGQVDTDCLMIYSQLSDRLKSKHPSTCCSLGKKLEPHGSQRHSIWPSKTKAAQQ
ncbi:hypothetical protein Q7C36_007668 [Tachysurus vachellii]|uniref:Uncharacterized protein n=1 Tax=Tachysurus vachellii TaxID=175792 RepID=A0AA88T397_TACVA|nr:hypothetical protein Q7C36_007668 [Tachysurus vachellii]